MNWDCEAIKAAHDALRTVNDAVDVITNKATQLESLLVLLGHTAGYDELPGMHRAQVCWLAAELAQQIQAAASTLALTG